MKFSPTLSEIEKLASTGKYDVAPVSCEILSDFTTPIETIRIFKNISRHCYMLESAQSNEKWGRYTFIGFDPKLEITCVEDEMRIGDLKVRTTCARYCQNTEVRVLTTCRRLRADLWATFHTTIWDTANRV